MARKAHNIHYIYKTTCNVTGRYYVGMHSTNNENDDYMGSGIILRRSIRKYGIENHTKEIIEYLPTRELLIEAEKLVITDDMVLDKDCMNLKLGGDGGWNEKHNKAFKYKLDNDLEFRKKFSERRSEINKEMISQGIIIPINEYYDWNGKNHSDVTKKLMSESSKGQGSGETNSQYGTYWVTDGITNKKIKKTDDIPDGWFKGRSMKNAI